MDNYDSRKGRELQANAFAALQFHWVELERVVRIEGRVEKVSDAESDAYFETRPLDSRIGAWASPQSQVIASRAVLVANAAKFGARFLLMPPRPPHWGGYRLVGPGAHCRLLPAGARRAPRMTPRPTFVAAAARDLLRIATRHGQGGVFTSITSEANQAASSRMSSSLSGLAMTDITSCWRLPLR